MLDWDYEVTCPYCGDEILMEYDPDGVNKRNITCDECGKKFHVSAFVEIDFDVYTEKIDPDDDKEDK